MRPSMDGPSDEPCPGCGRMELHKMCPAHGTPFYMSGIPFSKETEQTYSWLTGDNKHKYFCIFKDTLECLWNNTNE